MRIFILIMFLFTSCATRYPQSRPGAQGGLSKPHHTKPVKHTHKKVYKKHRFSL